MKMFFVLFLFAFAVGCGKDFSPHTLANLEEESSTSDPQDPSPIGEEDLFICSKLDFSEIHWPTNFTRSTQNSFALALNVTGSFEGSQSWATLAGDFDGMGLSLGLLQQNLGSATLQPLMATYKTYAEAKMKTHFSSAQWTSVSGMLNEWLRTNPIPSPALLSLSSTALFAPDDVVLSPLDSNSDSAFEKIEPFATAAVTQTLNWARQNVLTGKQVKAEWKAPLQSMANSIEYKNLQFVESTVLHNKTENLREYFGYKTLTAYLFLYDVVVQNGGFYQSNLTAYQDYVKKNPNSTELQRLKKLLEIRLVNVRSQYRADVNARKSTILNGTGTVHGSQRNLPKEYCFQGSTTL